VGEEREDTKYSTIIAEINKMRLQPSTRNHTAVQLNPYGGAIVQRNFLSSNTVKEQTVLVGFAITHPTLFCFVTR